MKVAGFGFRKAARVDSLAAALDLTNVEVTHLATVDEKAEAACFVDFAARAGLPVLPVTASVLKAAPVATNSAASQARFGTGSVAEASAMAAAGPGARLVSKRVVSPDGMATCAIAERETP